MLDFTKEELLEKIAKKEQLKEEVSKEIDDILSGRTAIRNVVVDRSNQKGSQLKDDRYKNPQELYDQAQQVQDRLDAAKREADKYKGTDNIPNTKEIPKNTSESYKGPSVISYYLENRKAMSLPIPVYKCVGGGDVKVIIVVNKSGYVLSATVAKDESSEDSCLIEYAIKAAKSSRFTASSDAPSRQSGEIVYRFIAQ